MVQLVGVLFRKRYLKLDTEGADGLILQQLSELPSKPTYMSLELNSLNYILQASQLGYRDFKVVPQSRHKAEHLKDEHGRPLTHAGDFGEDASGVDGAAWRDEGTTLDLCRSLCLVHDASADAPSFAAGPARYVDRDFATLRACFPIESKDDEEWYDIHCRHSSAGASLKSMRTMSEAGDPELSRRLLFVGGIFGWIFIHPVNTLGIRMNLASMQNPGVKLSLATFAADTVKKSGFSSLYNGLGAGIWRQVFYASSRYGLFQVFRDTLSQYREMDFGSRLFCATAAGGLAALFSCPCEVSLVRLSNDATLPEAERRNYKGVIDCAQRIAREEGVTAFWRGSTPFVTRACLVGATQVATYDQFKTIYGSFGIKGSSNVVASSFTAGLVYSIITMPFESAKNRMASQKPDPETGKLPYRGTMQTIQAVAGKEGAAALYNGFMPYCLRCGGHTVLMFFAVEELQKWPPAVRKCIDLTVRVAATLQTEVPKVCLSWSGECQWLGSATLTDLDVSEAPCLAPATWLQRGDRSGR
ncbi:misc-1 [Symbiodinium natans]|uniref:Misc-1 protein n=1 Tax=Symbiodinium natans TaxID=878477 RepID=A0A812NVI0_9DINO|nr:misc-1 [Symbiodinium natans]